MYPKSDQGAYLRGLAFGARFDFIDPAPGYSGPLYVIAAGATTDPPLVFVRDARGELVPASDGPDAAAE